MGGGEQHTPKPNEVPVLCGFKRTCLIRPADFQIPPPPLRSLTICNGLKVRGHQWAWVHRCIIARHEGWEVKGTEVLYDVRQELWVLNFPRCPQVIIIIELNLGWTSRRSR